MYRNVVRGERSVACTVGVPGGYAKSSQGGVWGVCVELGTVYPLALAGRAEVQPFIISVTVESPLRDRPNGYPAMRRKALALALSHRPTLIAKSYRTDLKVNFKNYGKCLVR